MKIDNSVISMSSSSQRQTVSKATEQLTSWVGKQPNGQTQVADADRVSIIDLMNKLKENYQYDALSKSSHVEQYEEELFTMSDEDQKKLEMLNKLLEALTGKKIKFFIPRKVILKQNMLQPLTGQIIPIQSQQGTALKGWGLNYQKSEYYSEQESMNFESVGKVTTSDGRNIQFDLSLNLSRSFVSESSISIKAGDALIDPLVINYDQPSATLTNTKYSFDLDLDGNSDQISFAKSGSGFLAYDKNNDGTINDGSELFGPKTGNGFLELTQYDTDGNNWIDENDPIFDKLQIWTKNEKGEDQLFAIGKKGIGAIYLGSVGSQYSLKDENNDTLGQIRQTGIFLKEDGTAGTIQHIDISL